MPLFFSFAQAREDLAFHTREISQQQLWRTVTGLGSLGFHLKHIAGSVDRLTTYLTGGQLTLTQLEFLKLESLGDESLQELLSAIDIGLNSAEDRLRRVDSSTLYDLRAVGRRSLPTTVLGLLVHLAEHTQRHVGQAVLLARLMLSRAI